MRRTGRGRRRPLLLHTQEAVAYRRLGVRVLADAHLRSTGLRRGLGGDKNRDKYEIFHGLTPKRSVSCIGQPLFREPLSLWRAFLFRLPTPNQKSKIAVLSHRHWRSVDSNRRCTLVRQSKGDLSRGATRKSRARLPVDRATRLRLPRNNPFCSSAWSRLASPQRAARSTRPRTGHHRLASCHREMWCHLRLETLFASRAFLLFRSN
jgi:hypothetical protein